MDEGTKHCPQCDRDLPTDRFTRDKTRPDGLFCYCRECKAAYAKARRDQDAVTRRIRDARPEVRERNLATSRKTQAERNKRYYERHKAENTARTREYARRNPERIRAISKRTRAKNPAAKKASQKSYYEGRGGRETYKAWRHRHRVEVLEIQRKRMGLIRASETHFTPQEWIDLKARYGNRCLCCGRVEGDIALVPDHVLPLSKGGSNGIDNIQPLCMPCNARKHTSATDYRPNSAQLPAVVYEA